MSPASFLAAANEAGDSHVTVTKFKGKYGKIWNRMEEYGKYGKHGKMVMKLMKPEDVGDVAEMIFESRRFGSEIG